MQQRLRVIMGQAGDHLPIGRLDKAKIIDHTITGQAHYETNVWPLGSLDGADTPIVAVMHVTHVETGSRPLQSAGAQRRECAFVCQLS